MKQIVQHLTDFILSHHSWFDKGYGNAFMDEDAGNVLWDSGSGYESLAFNDNQGNYFYIRHNGKINYSQTPSIAGCLAATKKSMPCTLVALLKQGDTFALEQCLINSILSWKNKGFIAVPSSAIIEVMDVIENEIGDREAAEIAKNNVGDHCLISISFNVVGDYNSVSPACPCNPCGC